MFILKAFRWIETIFVFGLSPWTCIYPVNLRYVHTIYKIKSVGSLFNDLKWDYILTHFSIFVVNGVLITILFLALDYFKLANKSTVLVLFMSKYASFCWIIFIILEIANSINEGIQARARGPFSFIRTHFAISTATLRYI